MIENIKFTKEEEHNNQLAFLDVLLTKTNDGTINTQVYRKKTHTDKILKFNSNHPTQHKIYIHGKKLRSCWEECISL